ncbi:MAG: hypothetical protein E7277_09535 [Lachnospiraceae bacterium]|jgi:hypothetical protein|nr:hypothetical protein [Lachnospiraceae bacterium]
MNLEEFRALNNFQSLEEGEVLDGAEGNDSFVDPASTNKYDIVTRVAYLIGVPDSILYGENSYYLANVCKDLERDKNARIIRNLCFLRTQLENNISKIARGIRNNQISLMNCGTLLDLSKMRSLDEDGVEIYVYTKEPYKFMAHLNRTIKQRINNCRSVFPDWLNWKYIVNLIVIPLADEERTVYEAATPYHENYNGYPYQCFINMPPENNGNILMNDKKFMTLLYKWNGDIFADVSRVADVSNSTKENIYNFLEQSDKCVFIVDCENSDPYSLCAAIKNLEEDRIRKIEKIILYDDVNASSAWETLSGYIDIPVEYMLINRLKDNKSLADIKVTARICKEFYQNEMRSFVLASSDSDFWGLIEEIPDAKFLVLVEQTKCSYALKQALMDKKIFYCYIDHFYKGGAEDIKKEILTKELAKNIRESFSINLHEIMNDALYRTRIRMTEEEVAEYIKRKLKNQIGIAVDENDILHPVYQAR